MKPLKMKGMLQMDVQIDPCEALTKIKEALGLAEGKHTFLCVRDGQLMLGEDVSYHGSPIYEYSVISNNPKWIDLYNSVQCIENYMKDCNNPEWQKVIDIESTEALSLSM